MNHYNDQTFYGHHLGPEGPSALLLSAGHRYLAAKLAAAAAASSTSNESDTSSSSPSNCKSASSSLTSSILYSAISAAAAASSAKSSPFAIPQPPPPLVSVASNSQQQSFSASSSFYPNLVNGSQQVNQGASEMLVIEGSSSNVCSTTSAVTSTTPTTTRGRGRGRSGSSTLGRPPKATRGSSSLYTSRSYSSKGREPPPPPSAPQVASVAAAHQNESHNSLAASMPLLSTYLMKGTITGYHNGHQMGKKANFYGTAAQQQKANSEPILSNVSVIRHLNSALESAGLSVNQQPQQRPPSVEVIEESDNEDDDDERKSLFYFSQCFEFSC